MRRLLALAGTVVLVLALAPLSGASAVGGGGEGGEAQSLTPTPRIFTDVSPSHPFAGPIQWMSDEGISTGFGDGSFRPTEPVSRQAMAAFMFRLDGQPAGDWIAAADTFTDVGAAHPFAEAIGWMAEEGISTGFPDNTFRPGDAVSRQAMAAFMYRLDGQPAGDWAAAGAGQFTDVGVGHPFDTAIGWMALEGISTGFADDTFRPGDAVSRQAMAAFMQRFADTEKLITTGNVFSCGVAFGGAWCWGTNGFTSGALGDNDNNFRETVPIRVGGLSTGVIAIESGGSHTCALVDGTSPGQVWCWGNNVYGQIGDGTTESPRSTATRVVGLPGPATSVSVGGSHSCAVVDGGAWCWGRNNDEQLGDGTDDDSPAPVQVSGLTSGVTQISAGGRHTCAIVSGSLRCWGFNNTGQLGVGDTDRRATQTQVSGLTSGVTQVSAGLSGTCAVVGGSARCWGNNGSGQIGDGTEEQRLTPVQVSGLTSGVTRVDTASGHTCAIVDGSAKCWGSNGNGELGDGTEEQRLTPVDVMKLGTVDDISVSSKQTAGLASRTCATTGRTAWCWGGGLLGDGGLTGSSEPERVLWG
ncbi:MAG: S-layer homology domain-containing protein [Acidimicrobiia bacterium]|nr:S-layer homology domain-containing protein [Acidimicrobiia bacterium]